MIRRRTTGGGQIAANMTPMIDVTFLLIVFFVVVSQVVDRDAVHMDLPSPERAVAGSPDGDERLVLNLVPMPDGQQIVVEGEVIDMNGVTVAVAASMADGIREVYLRADSSIPYKHAHEVIEAVRLAGGTPRLHLVVQSERRDAG
jgi:biopolymer transport protein ExbD